MTQVVFNHILCNRETNMKYICLFFLVYTQCKCKELQSATSTPVLFQVTWVFYCAFYPAAIAVTILYWGTLYEGENHSCLTHLQPIKSLEISTCFFNWDPIFFTGGSISYINFATHGLNGIYVIIDVLLASTPHRILNFWVVQIYAGAYVIFAAIYWGIDNDNVIYNVLDFGENTGSAVGLSVFVTVVGAPLIHFLLFFLYWLRKLIFESCSNENAAVGPESSSSYSVEKQGHDNPSLVV